MIFLEKISKKSEFQLSTFQRVTSLLQNLKKNTIMNYFKVLAILLFSSVISFYACNDNDADIKKEAKESLNVSSSPTQPNAATPNPATPEPAQNAAGVWHYTCNAGCAGGAGAAGTCGTCGGALAHNQVYHPNNNNNSTPTTINSPITPPAAEPAQNTAGVWHYTCSTGCAGGGGATGTCGTCGGTLAHNSAYH